MSKFNKYTVFVEVSGDCEEPWDVYRHVMAKNLSGAHEHALRNVKRDFGGYDGDLDVTRTFHGWIKEVEVENHIATIWYHEPNDQLGILRVYFLGGSTFEGGGHKETDCEVDHAPHWLMSHGWKRIDLL